MQPEPPRNASLYLQPSPSTRVTKLLRASTASLVIEPQVLYAIRDENGLDA